MAGGGHWKFLQGRRPTAVRVLRPEMAGEKNLARFEREVQLTSGLTHPNTIAIYDYGRTPDGMFYYAMEFLDGINLEDLVRRVGPQCPGRTIHILRQIAASLVEAHGVGLIHRDVKPANVILCERGGFFDVVKVVDFGLVKAIDTPEDSSISAANTITGTPHYLSPEAIRSADPPPPPDRVAISTRSGGGSATISSLDCVCLRATTSWRFVVTISGRRPSALQPGSAERFRTTSRT